jgi:Flp pilus assembly protein TadG
MKRLQRGQGLLEFALLTPVLLTFLFAVIDGGRLVLAYQTVGEAARSGAHQAQLVDSSLAQVQAAVNAHSGVLGGLGSNTTVNPSATPRTPGTTVTVTVTYRFNLITPLFATFPGVNLASTSVVTTE